MLKINFKVLICFRHGLGDQMQLTIVLRHIISQRPNWKVDLLIREGRSKIFNGLCNKIYEYGNDKVDKTKYNLVFDPPEVEVYKNNNKKIYDAKCELPQGWVLFFIEKRLKLIPEERLFHYYWIPDNESIKLADEFIRKLSGKFVAIHYHGNSNGILKCFNKSHVLKVCNLLKSKGIIPVIIDFNETSPIPDNEFIFRADIPKDAGVLAALIKKSILFLGIDSGCAYIAGAVGVKSIVIWERNSPMSLFGLNQNVTHYHPNGFNLPLFKTTDDYMELINQL